MTNIARFSAAAVRFSAAAVILALGMILSSALLSKLFVSIKHEKEIRVKGYAERNVVSDVGKFYCSYSTRKPTLVDAYKELQVHRNLVIKYLNEKGIKAEDIAIGEINTSKLFKKDLKGNDTNEIQYYEAKQGIQITSKNVTLVGDISRGITDLIKDGVDISASSPCFYVSDLHKLKVELIAEATQDGHERAVTMAKNSGGEVGPLRSARQGVFQITEPYSTRTSGYGVYDTSTIRKTVKAVVTLEYSID